MASKVWIQLPQDHYAHPAQPTEWWWTVGTLISGDCIFGFEITVNGRSVAQGGLPAINFTEIMLTDVASGAHYQKTAGQRFSPDWAESRPSNPWYARMSAPDGNGSVSMTASADNPLAMSVQASFQDETTGTAIAFDLQLDQQGPPLIVFGTGRHNTAEPPDPPAITR